MSTASTPVLIKQPDTLTPFQPRPFDLAKCLRAIANHQRGIAQQIDKLAAQGFTVEQLRELGIVKSV